MVRRGRAFLFWPLFSLMLVAPLAVSSKEKPQYKTALFPSGTKIQMEVADTESARRVGLMFREKLPTGAGMLFIFPVPAPYRFWTKNCNFPIDIIWLSQGKEIVYIAQNVPPCKSDPCPSFGPNNQSALYVIETSAGLIKKEELHIGTTVKF